VNKVRFIHDLNVEIKNKVGLLTVERIIEMNNNEKVNILLVDDRPENLLALEAIIEHEGLNLVTASSGEEALRSLLKYDFAAILLDVQMPGIDGFETAKIIKAREKTKNVPILFITANNMESEHIFTGYSMGAVDYILKPFDPIILKAKVDAFVEIYKMNRILIKQAEILTNKTNELEQSYQELSKITSDLRVSEALANVISETSIDSMLVIDQEGMVLKVNPAVEKMFGYKATEILGQNILMLFTGDESQEYLLFVLDTINNLEHILGHNLRELTATRRNGEEFPVEIQVGKRFVQDQCIVACTIRDLTRQKEYENEITHMAYHDWLTDLPNRRKFNDELKMQLQVAKSNNQPLALLYVDMDHFKSINDSLGHIVGDTVIQKMAKRLKNCLRNEDFVARVGGDEFNILLPKTNRELAVELAEEIMEVFKEPFLIDNYELFVTACTGVSIFPYDGEDAGTLVKNADAALYRAKEHGRNSFKVFHSGMNIQSYRSFQLQNDLRKALERNEFKLVYQPRIHIGTSKITSAEALIRWDHPNWGMILPSEFIPLAEESNLIVEIGKWVLAEACRQNKAWQEAGLEPIRIAVNFSSQQFLQKDLIENISSILTQTGITPDRIEIEITESVIFKNELAMTQTLKKLRNMGIYLSMDDFGMGYSSLKYLRQFPVHSLKIDKSFIQDLSSRSPESISLVAAIVSLAHSLKMSVVAEGVETEGQLNQLRELECEEFQGYFFSPPVSANEFEDFLFKSQDKTEEKNIKPIAYKPTKNVIHKGTDFTESDLNPNGAILSAALTRIQTIYSISSREMDVFKLIVEGLSNKEISEKLFISEHTVKNHITRIFQKLTVNDRLQAMAKVYQTCIDEGEGLLLS